MIKGKRILVIGGTGTIGIGIVKKLLRQKPEVIRVYSRDEYKQYLMQHDLKQYRQSLRFLIGDVRDTKRLRRAMRDIDIVFDLAALKHVPACEYNPFEAVQTNVIGVQNVISIAMESGVETVVYTSSDKAISPTNVMGATKLLGERLISSASTSKGAADTIFTAVRFGNVMGSRGSVIPLFKKQILTKRKITVTNGSMTRFMMSLSDAVNLTIKASHIAKGGEIFVLKMPIMKLHDLAQVVIEEVCEKYGISSTSVEIEEIGLRAGEKMYEELMTVEESAMAYELEDMYAVMPLENQHTQWIYKDSRQAPSGSYSSTDGDVIDKEQIREIIRKEGLI